MARCFWTLALCLLMSAVATAQAPGDEGPGDGAGSAARRARQPAVEPEEEMEEPAEGERGRRRGRGEESDESPGRGGPGEDRGRFGGGFRRGNPIFEALDTDGDQSISAAELRRAAASLKKLDVDGDNKITLAEASPAGGPGGPGGPFGGGDPAQMVDGMIRQMDRNRDGRIGLDEVDERSLRMLSNIRDANGDGALDRAELMAGMEQMRQRFGGGPGGGGPGGGFDGARMTERLMANDQNGDGKLSADEVPEQFQGMLRGGDENEDGMIDARELEMATRRMGERFRGGFGGDRGGRGERGAGRGGDEEREGEEGGDRRLRRQRPEAEE
jgi:Ca2+-binding EF-hand superfamily protein